MGGRGEDIEGMGREGERGGGGGGSYLVLQEKLY